MADALHLFAEPMPPVPRAFEERWRELEGPKSRRRATLALEAKEYARPGALLELWLVVHVDGRAYWVRTPAGDDENVAAAEQLYRALHGGPR